jgi:hypothetical protein
MLLWVGYYVYRIRVRGRIRRMVDGDVDVKTLKGLGGRVDVVSECSGEYSMSSGRRRGLVGMWLGCSIRTTGEELMMPAVGRMFWRVGLAWRQMCVCVCACVRPLTLGALISPEQKIAAEHLDRQFVELQRCSEKRCRKITKTDLPLC